MNFLDIDFQKLKHPDFVFLLLGIIFLTTPGILTLFYFERTAFETLDLLKLILLSISLVSPFVTINTFLLAYAFEPEDDKARNSMYASFLTSIFVSGLLLYLVVLFGLSGETFRQAVSSATSFEFLLAIMCAYQGNKKRKAAKQQIVKSGTAKSSSR